MITVVRLENWRAYRSFELELKPGTTFLVASNGVGKTSLIDALRWALDPGQPAQPDMLHGSTMAGSVEVELAAGSHHVRIRRSLSKGRAKAPKSETEAWIDHECRDAADVYDMLEDQWGADNQFLTRAAFLTDRCLYADEEPDLLSHLSSVFGLDHLQRTIEYLAPAITEAKRAAEAARTEVAGTEQDLRHAEDAVNDATVKLESAKEIVEAARVRSLEAGKLTHAAERAAAGAADLTEWHSQRDRIVTAAMSVVGTVPLDVDVRVVLQAAETGMRTQAEEARERRAVLTSRINAAQAELARLRTAGGTCPVCRRPLDDVTRGAAEHQHKADEGVALDEIATIDIDGPSAAANQVRDLLRQADRLGPAPPAPDPGFADPAVLQAEAHAASEAHQTAVADLREAEIRLATAIEARDDIRDALEGQVRVPKLYRRQATLEAARVALEATITEVLESNLVPVIDEVNRRWDALFVDRSGLRLRPNGDIVRRLEDQDLPFKSFSSGEKMMAKLLVRLATLIKTTRVPFCWVDEPLEHLDPDARRFVASTLACLSEDNTLSQIFVTTYEEPLANVLADRAGDRVHLNYLRTARSS